MNDNPTLRTPESYLDEVAQENGFKDFNSATHCYYIYDEVAEIPRKMYSDLIHEAMRRMCEDAFKAQKEICEEHAEREAFSNIDRELIIDVNSIRSAPTPLITKTKTDYEQQKNIARSIL